MKPDFEQDGIQLWCGDCMDLMREYPDGHFDLAIVDPPYGIGCDGQRGHRNTARIEHKRKNWDSNIPERSYFEELRRVSRNQIIWGGNFFSHLLPPFPCVVIWDKMQDSYTSEFETAWTSLDRPPKAFRMARCCAYVGRHRMHPTQKPEELYLWLLANYAKPGQRILDTHLGSGSHALACIRYGCPLVASEIDADYMAGAIERVKRELAQGQLFSPAPPVHQQATFA